MKTILTILTIGFFTLLSKAQEYSGLSFLYFEGKYEVLADKAMSYTQDENHKNEALPYVYCAMAYTKLSSDSQFEEKYPNALNTAVEYMLLFKEKDTAQLHYYEYSEHVSDLRSQIIEEVKNAGDVSKPNAKMLSYCSHLVSLDASYDAGAWLMQGYCQYSLGQTAAAEASVEKSKSILDDAESIELLYSEQLLFLKFALLTYSEYLAKKDKKSEAVEWLEIGKEIFEEDEDFLESIERYTN